MSAPPPPPAAGRVTPAMLLPGRAGVLAVLAAYAALPPAAALAFLAEAHEGRVNRHGFQAALARDWKAAGWSVVAAAGTRERLLAWFAYADFRDATLPWLRDLCDPARLPAGPFPVWRGGCGDPAEVAAGASWTLHRPVAAFYALAHRARGVPGRPAVVRRRATRAEVAACFHDHDREVVLAGPGAWAADTPGEAELERLAVEARAEGERMAREQARVRQAYFAATDEERMWRGWRG